MRLTLFAASAALAASLFAQQSTAYHAKILTDDGTPPPKVPLILGDINSVGAYQCFTGHSTGGQVGAGMLGPRYFSDGTIEYRVLPSQVPDTGQPRLFDDSCPVVIRVAGYETAHVVLHDGSTVVLHRVGGAPQGSVSITELRAPADARKAYTKGLAALGDNKLDAARKSFEKAVAIYPAYAQAWVDLSQTDQNLKRAPDARTSAESAVKADPGFAPGIAQLARVQLDAGESQAAYDLIAKVPHASDSAALQYYRAVAAFNLKKFNEAAASATRCIALDPTHTFARAEYLLGLAILALGDSPGAAKHLRAYLEISPVATDAVEVRSIVARLEK